MALIQCRECQKEYSDLSRICPRCGCPTEFNTTGSDNQYQFLSKNKQIFGLKTVKLKNLILGSLIVLVLISVVITKSIDATSKGNEPMAWKNEAVDSASVTNEAISLTLQTGDLSGNYTGTVKDDLPEGYGAFTCLEKGWTYIGNWQKGHFSGDGERMAENGQTEGGTYENDLLNGDGYYKDPSGFEYSGAFNNGEFNGTGTMKFPYTGTSFQGSFTNGIPDDSFKPACSPISMAYLPYNVLQYKNVFGQAVYCGGSTMSLISGEERASYSGGDLLNYFKSPDGDKYYIVSIGQGLYCVIAMDSNVSINSGQYILFYGISIGTYDSGRAEYPLIKAYYYDYF